MRARCSRSCALASGSNELDELAAARDVRAHPGRRRPDGAPGRVLAGRRAERGRRLRRAARDALGARAGRHARARQQGEPRRGGRPRPRGAGAGWRPAPPGRQRALRGLPVPRGARARDRRLPGAHRLGRPVPRPNARRARRRDAGRRAGASDLADGPEDHRRLGHARQQGARADRGALPVRPALRADRGRRAPDLGRPRDRPLPRRRLARAPRLPGHASPDLLRADLSRESGNARRAARLLGGAVPRVRAARPGDVPAARARQAGRRVGRDVSVRATTPRTRSQLLPSSRAGSRSSTSPASSQRRSKPSTGHRPPTSRSSSRPTPRPAATPRAQQELWCREHLRRDPRARAARPRPRGRPLLHRSGGRDEPAPLLHRVPAARSRRSSGTASSTASVQSRWAAT